MTTQTQPTDTLGGRDELADKLTACLGNLKDGATIAIDADWGAGKTFFGTLWNRKLRDQGYTTIWLDAFAMDFAEDPFFPIAAKILKVVADPTCKETILQGIIRVGGTLAPSFLKALVNESLKYVPLANNVVESVADDMANAAGAWAQAQLDNATLHADAVAALKKQIEAFAGKLDKPLIIFVDELDRCRPDFAIRTIERIKHLFEVKNVVFVLLLNRPQLVAAIKGFYGESFDAQTYLQKFILCSFALPKIENHGAGYDPFLGALYPSHQSLGVVWWAFSGFLNDIAHAWPLSLRELERCMILWRLFPCLTHPELAAFLMALKIKHPPIFDRLKQRDKTVLEDLRGLSSRLSHAQDIEEPKNMTKSFEVFLTSTEEAGCKYPPQTIRSLLDRIDLPISA